MLGHVFNGGFDLGYCVIYYRDLEVRATGVSRLSYTPWIGPESLG
jgi:hypothetical protein